MTKELTGVERLKVWAAIGSPVVMDANAIKTLKGVLDDISITEKRLIERRDTVRNHIYVLVSLTVFNVGLLAITWWVG
jgi:hypothetical protein